MYNRGAYEDYNFFPQVCIWIYLWIDDKNVVEMIGKVFIAGIFIFIFIFLILILT